MKIITNQEDDITEDDIRQIILQDNEEKQQGCEINKKRREILVDETMTTNKAVIIRRHLYDLVEEDSSKPITLLIDSSGGDLDAAFIIIGAIQAIRLEYGTQINGLVIGKAISSAFILLQFCDERIAYPYSRFLVHSIKLIFPRDIEFSFQEISERLACWDTYPERIVDQFVKRTCISKKKWTDKYLSDSRDHFFTTEEALKYGIIDKIIGDE